MGGDATLSSFLSAVVFGGNVRHPFLTKARLIVAPRQVSESHPFIVATDAVQRYFTVMSECATASKLRAGAK